MKKMKQLLTIAALLLGYCLQAQVAINTTGSAANGSAILDMTSTTKGILIPRMTQAERNSISAVIGLLIYQTDNTPGFYFHDGGGWKVVGSGAFSIDDLSDGKTELNGVFLGPGLNTANTGSYNCALGENALYSCNGGHRNVAVGYQALYSHTGASDNVAIGYKALYGWPGTGNSQNIAIGNETLLANENGYSNIAIGNQVLATNSNGSYNVGILGCVNNITGNYNVAIGYQALDNNNSGSNNVAIGRASGPTSSSLSNTGAFGYGATTTSSNTIHIGNTSITEIAGQVAFSTYSDKRFKRNIQYNVAGLDFIMKLRPVTYQWDVEKLDQYIGAPEPDDDIMKDARSKQEAITYTGFLAQEVEQAAREVNYNFSGVIAPANENTPYSLRYAQFVVPLVKAMQEQQQLIEELRKRIEELEKKQ